MSPSTYIIIIESSSDVCRECRRRNARVRVSLCCYHCAIGCRNTIHKCGEEIKTRSFWIIVVVVSFLRNVAIFTSAYLSTMFYAAARGQINANVSLISFTATNFRNPIDHVRRHMAISKGKSRGSLFPPPPRPIPSRDHTEPARLCYPPSGPSAKTGKHANPNNTFLLSRVRAQTRCAIVFGDCYYSILGCTRDEFCDEHCGLQIYLPNVTNSR